ncbi:MAG: tetratricopeptide repeat protein [Alphaproteobacteria bacterium]|nr:tetratricopeptide repeat protein [Alphaproteobacteria bacterium]
MKGFIRFVCLVVFLGTAWVVIPILMGGNKEPEKRLIGALNFLQETIQYSRPVPFDLDVFDSPTVELESAPDIWSISAILTITSNTGTEIKQPYTAVVENVCPDFGERKCWRLVQLTIRDTVLGNQQGSIRAALEEIVPSIPLQSSLPTSGTDKTGTQPPKDRSTKAPTVGMLQTTGATVTPGSKATAKSAAKEAQQEANKPATTQMSKAPPVDGAEAFTVQSTDKSPSQPDNSLVLMIQSQLRDRGLDPGPIDGVAGPRTRAAIVTYQRGQNLTPDGIPSQSLLNSLESGPRGQAQMSATTPQVALVPANAGFMVELSAFGTAEATRREKNRLQEALSDLLSETELSVERIDLGEKGVQYQVQARNYPDRLTANYMCARVRARKRFCQVVTPTSLARAISIAKFVPTVFPDKSEKLPSSAQENGPSYARAGVQAQKNGAFRKAIELYSLAIGSDDMAPKELARVYNNRGAAYKNMDFLDLAITDYSTAIRLKKDYARAYYNRGIALGNKGLLDDAIKDYSTAIRLKPGDAAAYNYRGLAYEKAGLHQKAIADFSQAIRLAPDLSYAYFNRGLSYEVTNERRRAIIDFKKSYSLNPNSSTYQIKLKDIGLLQ